MATLLPPGKSQFCDSDGKPLAGGTIAFYVPGTTTPSNTWQDAAETTLNTNPIVLDAAGEAVIYGTGVYRTILQDSGGNQIWDQQTSDGVSATGDITVTGNITASGDLSVGGNFAANTITVPGAATLSSATFSADAFFTGPSGNATVATDGSNMFQGIQAVGAPDFSVFAVDLKSTTSNYAVFNFNGANVGSITSRDGATTAYNTTSDYRLKTTFGPYSDAGIIDAVPVHDGAFKAAPSIRRPMFLAHELQECAPWAVDGAKDATGASGGIIPQQVDHSALVPLLWAEMQALRARVAALEGAK